MPKRPKKLNTNELRRARAAKAMPEVKAIVKRFGRMAVANCLNKIRERDKGAERLAALKKQVTELERRL
jgi:hypothetical protein